MFRDRIHVSKAKVTMIKTMLKRISKIMMCKFREAAIEWLRDCATGVGTTKMTRAKTMARKKANSLSTIFLMTQV